MKKIIITTLLALSVLPLVANALEDPNISAIKARIKPVGEVRVAGEKQGAAPETTNDDQKPAETVAKIDGKSIYTQYCSVCHAAGVAGAPKFGDASSWKDRGDIKTLLKTSLSGKGAMPAKGTCMTCTDEQMKAAIEYMLPKG